MVTWNTIEGDGNIIVGGNLLVELSLNEQLDIFREYFTAADLRFKNIVSASGLVLRISKSIAYSSESIFTSLMQIGLPADVAVRIPLAIISQLRAIADEKKNDELLTTADVRVAVVRTLESLRNSGRFPAETVEMWSAAYIRRYGNPDSQFIKVIDYGVERDLNYQYLSNHLLPHLFNKILGLERDTPALEMYHRVFTGSRIDDMSTEIIRAVNTLNLYAVHYRTLLHLVQDIILQPPHPWMVSSETMARVTEYNCERMTFHHSKISDPITSTNIALLGHAYQEFYRHSCAAILSMYGAFIGVGAQYGLSELARILKIRKNNFPLWSYCKIKNIDVDLQAINCSIGQLSKLTDRAQGALAHPASDGKHLVSLQSGVKFLYPMVLALRKRVQDEEEEI